MIAQPTYFFRDVLALCHQDAGVAKRTQVFGGITAECGELAERANAASLITRAMGLRSVLDQPEIAALANLLDLSQCDGLSIKMHGDDRPGARRDCSFNLRGVHLPAAIVRIDEAATQPDHCGSRSGRDESVG